MKIYNVRGLDAQKYIELRRLELIFVHNKMCHFIGPLWNYLENA